MWLADLANQREREGKRETALKIKKVFLLCSEIANFVNFLGAALSLALIL